MKTYGDLDLKKIREENENQDITNNRHLPHTITPIEVKAETVRCYTGLTDFFCRPIYEDDVVELPTGQKGRVCSVAGAWGVTVSEFNRDEAEKIIKKTCGNSPHFIHGKNESVSFYSFYELIESFCPNDIFDGKCSAVCVVTDKETKMDDFRGFNNVSSN